MSLCLSAPSPAVSLCARGVCLPSLLLCRCVPVVSVCPLSYAVSLCARGVSLPPLLLLVLRARGALSALSAGAGAGAGAALHSIIITPSPLGGHPGDGQLLSELARGGVWNFGPPHGDAWGDGTGPSRQGHLGVGKALVV